MKDIINAPWIKNPNRIGGEDISFYVTDRFNNRHYIARVYNNGITSDSSPESESIANLIGAAPDLLKAIRPLLDAYIGAQISEFAGTGWEEDTDPIIINARAAIKKATGG